MQITNKLRTVKTNTSGARARGDAAHLQPPHIKVFMRERGGEGEGRGKNGQILRETSWRTSFNFADLQTLAQGYFFCVCSMTDGRIS